MKHEEEYTQENLEADIFVVMKSMNHLNRDIHKIKLLTASLCALTSKQAHSDFDIATVLASLSKRMIEHIDKVNLKSTKIH